MYGEKKKGAEWKRKREREKSGGHCASQKVFYSLVRERSKYL